MLTATRPDDYIAAIGDLLTLWRAAGGHVEPRPQDPLPHDLAPYPEGSLPSADHDPPVRPHFGMVYAFDQGAVWFWRAGRCKQITDLEPTADEAPPPHPHHGHYE